ncbi:TPA: hypothetical protein ACKTGI_004007 [Pseudomonas aeruginosa]|uniref:hypothetical protein n=2 Tax=Pseudomonas aeruginosa TaxID=287 RepID=UPI00106D4FFD|nr:hypothetical protein [Pseudomonas aeruginosa]MBG6343812.1 hypothetical protein [Pseudomonas aeruginosa]MBG7170623.1 hypothetical protein [Pseudomonas aeruginosa]MBH8780902.1 hypothetical protein [Pseudomonas aeruginosa]MBI8783846.1 hypothetical protein [Pseudomonas aeruginosa]MBI8898997.1 hypothetical protein [Pseudomonas aeruginosa]
MEVIYKSFIMLANASVKGVLKYKDFFQIIPAPDDFPRAPCLEAHHPCLLELKYKFEFDPDLKMPDGKSVPEWIQQKDQEGKIIHEISSLFGMYSLSYFVFSSGGHSWSINTEAGSDFDLQWRQLSYFVADGKHQHKISKFTDAGCLPMGRVETSKVYNFGARFIGDDFSIPDLLPEILDSYYILEQDDRDAISRVASIFNSALKIKAISSSISFAIFVSSIESLVDYQYRGVKVESCKECNAPRYSVTRKFTDFLKRYSSDSDELVRFYKSTYGRRSKILHAGALFLGEHIPLNWAEDDWSAYHMRSGIERICRIAFANWLLERAQMRKRTEFCVSGTE